LSGISSTRQPNTFIGQSAMLEGADLKRLLEHAGTPDIERTQANLFAGLEAQGTPLEPHGESVR